MDGMKASLWSQQWVRGSRGHTGVVSPVSGAKREPATPSPWGARGAERQRELNTLPEGLGHLVLRRHQRHPWGPGEGWRGER